MRTWHLKVLVVSILHGCGFANIPQTFLGFEGLVAAFAAAFVAVFEYMFACKLLRGTQAAICSGNGDHVIDFVVELLFSSDSMARNVLAGVDKEVGGMRNIFLKPSKAMAESRTFLCDNIELFAVGTQQRTRISGWVRPRVISSVVD